MQNGAPDAEKSVFVAQLQAMYAALGYTSAAAWAERVDTAERLAPEIYRIADALVALHPEAATHACRGRSRILPF
jgi:hypothetical protein